MKHTPGPWHVDGHNLTAVIKNEGSEIWPQWRHICNCDYGYADPEKHFESNKSNAKLIAAAPELLDVLKNLYMSVYAGNSVSIEDAMARSVKSDEFEQNIIRVIKKATV